jgi:hypothetical protein
MRALYGKPVQGRKNSAKQLADKASALHAKIWAIVARRLGPPAASPSYIRNPRSSRERLFLTQVRNMGISTYMALQPPCYTGVGECVSRHQDSLRNQQVEIDPAVPNDDNPIRYRGYPNL